MRLNCCNLIIKLKQMRSCFLWVSKESGFLRWNLLPGKTLWRLLNFQTTKDLENTRHLIDKEVAGFQRITSNFERGSLGKMLWNNIACRREIVHERKCQPMWQTSLLSCFKNLPQPSQPSATTTLVRQEPLISRQEPPPAKRFQLLKAQMTISIL